MKKEKRHLPDFSFEILGKMSQNETNLPGIKLSSMNIAVKLGKTSFLLILRDFQLQLGNFHTLRTGGRGG